MSFWYICSLLGEQIVVCLFLIPYTKEEKTVSLMACSTGYLTRSLRSSADLYDVSVR